MSADDDAEASRVTSYCLTCGERIEGEDWDDMIHAYTDHQTEEHGKPRTVG